MCSVTGVGEAIMRAGMARAVTAQLSCSSNLAVDCVCEAAIRENILEGQPAALACPHKDCGILAVRVRSSGEISMLNGILRRVLPPWPPGECIMRCREWTLHNIQRMLLPVSSTAGSTSVSSPCYADFEAQIASSRLGKGADGACTDAAVQSGREKRAKTVDVELGVSFNSHSMGFAFMHSGMRTPKCMVLRQKSGAEGYPHDYEAFCCFGSQHSWAA